MNDAINSSAGDGAQVDDGCTEVTSQSASFLAMAIELGFDARKPRDDNARHILVGLRFLAQLRASEITMITTYCGLMVWTGDAWRQPCKKWLAVQIERACISLSIDSSSALIKETRAWLSRQPELWHNDVPQYGCKPSGVQP